MAVPPQLLWVLLEARYGQRLQFFAHIAKQQAETAQG
jgi:hypothetical protein